MEVTSDAEVNPYNQLVLQLTFASEIHLCPTASPQPRTLEEMASTSLQPACAVRRDHCILYKCEHDDLRVSRPCSLSKRLCKCINTNLLIMFVRNTTCDAQVHHVQALCVVACDVLDCNAHVQKVVEEGRHHVVRHLH